MIISVAGLSLSQRGDSNGLGLVKTKCPSGRRTVPGTFTPTAEKLSEADNYHVRFTHGWVGREHVCAGVEVSLRTFFT